MSPQLVSPLRKLSRLLPAVLLFAVLTNGAAAATAPTSIGAGSLDDWLALGLAMLAALYCVQKRE